MPFGSYTTFEEFDWFLTSPVIEPIYARGSVIVQQILIVDYSQRVEAYNTNRVASGLPHVQGNVRIDVRTERDHTLGHASMRVLRQVVHSARAQLL